MIRNRQEKSPAAFAGSTGRVGEIQRMLLSVNSITDSLPICQVLDYKAAV